MDTSFLELISQTSVSIFGLSYHDQSRRFFIKAMNYTRAFNASDAREVRYQCQ